MIMSFSFMGAGTKADVIHQVRSHHIADESGFGNAVRHLVTEALSEEQLASDYQYLYIVKANGHSGPGAAVSLNVSIEPIWVPSIRPPAEETNGHDLGIGFPVSEQSASGDPYA